MLAIAYLGSRSSTRIELNEFLCFNHNETLNHDEYQENMEICNQIEQLDKSIKDSNSDGLILESATRVFCQNNYSINPDFINMIVRHSKIGVEQLDFEDHKSSANKINKWINEKTHGKINRLIEQNLLDETTRMILVNAIYFKGSWEVPFDNEKTSKYEFKMADGSKKLIDMMIMTGKRFRYLHNPSELNVSVCALPYKGKQLSMTIILPSLEVCFLFKQKSVRSTGILLLLIIFVTLYFSRVH